MEVSFGGSQRGTCPTQVRSWCCPGRANLQFCLEAFAGVVARATKTGHLLTCFRSAHLVRLLPFGTHWLQSVSLSRPRSSCLVSAWVSFRIT